MVKKSIDINEIAKKAATNEIEVEDLLNVAVRGNKSHADNIEDLCVKYGWLDAERAKIQNKVPLGAWSQVVIVYLREGYRGLKSLVNIRCDERSNMTRFVVSLLEVLHTKESAECLIEIADGLLDDPAINMSLSMKFVSAVNMLFSFQPRIEINNEDESRVRSFLHKLIELNLPEDDVALIYCALRGVGDESSITLIGKRKSLQGKWKGTEKVVIKKIKTHLKK